MAEQLDHIICTAALAAEKQEVKPDSLESPCVTSSAINKSAGKYQDIKGQLNQD